MNEWNAVEKSEERLGYKNVMVSVNERSNGKLYVQSERMNEQENAVKMEEEVEYRINVEE